MSSILFSKFPLLIRPNVINNFIPLITCENNISTSALNLAARRGTRERRDRLKKKNKKVVEVKAVGWIPYHLKKKMILDKRDKHRDNQDKPDPIDDVYLCKFYRSQIYPIAEGIECHKQTHHPTMYNCMDANLNLKIEINMVAEKSTRFIDSFHGAALLPHSFGTESNKAVLVFSGDKDVQQRAIAAGATAAGGKELIKKVQEGEVNIKDFDFVATEPSFLSEVVPLRGLLRKKFPQEKSGSVSNDVEKMVKNLLNALDYRVVRDEYQKNYGQVETVIGTLNMETQQLVENFEAVVKSVDAVRPRRAGKFITRCILTSPPSREFIRVDPFEFVERGEEEPVVEEKVDDADANSDIEDEKDDVKAKAAA